MVLEKRSAGLIRNISITVIIFTLAIASYWDEQKTLEERVSQNQGRRLFHKPINPSIIRVFSDNMNIVSLHKDDNGVWQESDSSFIVDQNMVGRYIKTLNDILIKKKFDKVMLKGGMGAAGNGYRIELSSEAEFIELVVGNRSPVGFSRYLYERHGASIFLVSEAISLSLCKKRSDFYLKH